MAKECAKGKCSQDAEGNSDLSVTSSFHEFHSIATLVKVRFPREQRQRGKSSMDLSYPVTFLNPEAADHYQCAICRQTIVNAVSLCPNHFFCYECAYQLQQRNSYEIDTESGFEPAVRCPMCRREIPCVNIQRMEMIDHEIQALMVKCPNYEITVQRAKALESRYKFDPNAERAESADQNLENVGRRSNMQRRSGWRPSRRSLDIISRSKSVSAPPWTGNRARSRSRSRDRFVISCFKQLVYS